MKKDKSPMSAVFDEIMEGDVFGNKLDISPTYSLNRPHPTDPAELLKFIKDQKDKKRQMYESMREQYKIDLAKTIGRENIFRFAYVPFVVAELAWDYAESVVSLAAMCRRPETRSLSRKIRELYRQYRSDHDRFIDSAHHENEINNMYIYEDAVLRIFKLYLINLKCDLRSEYPDLDGDAIEFLVGVYQCYVTLQALVRYTHDQERKIAEIVGHPVGHILPKSVTQLSELILKYVGDKPASDRFNKLQETFILTFANQIALVELNDN